MDTVSKWNEEIFRIITIPDPIKITKLITVFMIRNCFYNSKILRVVADCTIVGNTNMRGMILYQIAGTDIRFLSLDHMDYFDSYKQCVPLGLILVPESIHNHFYDNGVPFKKIINSDSISNIYKVKRVYPIPKLRYKLFHHDISYHSAAKSKPDVYNYYKPVYEIAKGSTFVMKTHDMAE